MTPLELTGRTDSHIVKFPPPAFAAEKQTGHAFLEMKRKAEIEGFQLFPISAFRDFNSQLNIWNQKYRGERPLYDKQGNQRDHKTLSTEEKVFAILDWSALPGGSRHHWGTEIDLIDEASIPEGYQIKLLPSEFGKGGIFERLNTWLSDNMQSFGFFRPYHKNLGGVNPEPWHLSYKVISKEALQCLTLTMIQETIEQSDILGKKTILEQLPQIYDQYILNISTPH